MPLSYLELEQQLQATRQALQASELRFHNIIDNAGNGILVIGRGGEIRFANRPAERLLGRSAAELIGTRFGYAVAAGDIAEIELLQPGSTKIVAELHVSDSEWEGQPAYLIALCNITARKLAETALRDSENKFRSIVEQSNDAIVLADETGRLIEWNPAAEQMLGLPRTEVMGRMVWEGLFRILPPERQTPETAHHLKSLWLTFFQTGNHPTLNQPQELEIQQADGSRRRVQTLFHQN